MYKDLIVSLTWIFKDLKNEGKGPIFDGDDKCGRSTIRGMGPRGFPMGSLFIELWLLYRSDLHDMN